MPKDLSKTLTDVYEDAGSTPAGQVLGTTDGPENPADLPNVTVAPRQAPSRTGPERALLARDHAPQPDESDRSERAALALRERLANERARAGAKPGSDAEDEQVMWYIECPDVGCRGPGVWIHRDPAGPLADTDWSASYKARRSRWPTSRGELTPLVCQCCAAEGKSVELQLFHTGGKPVVNSRFLRSMPMELYRELAGLQDSVQPKQPQQPQKVRT